jgi:DNA replication protein DnaC
MTAPRATVPEPLSDLVARIPRRAAAFCRECCVAVSVDGDWRCRACLDRAVVRRRDAVQAAVLASIPSHYRWAHFRAPELRARVTPPRAIDDASRATDAHSVVIMGAAGAGKTSLATALLVDRVNRNLTAEHSPALSARQSPAGIFTNTFEIAKARREHRLGDGEAHTVAIAISARILLLDELGSESDGNNTAVAELIHARHEQDRPTIFTTPFTAQQLAARYGDGVARRVFENAVVIRLGEVHKQGADQ